jgi:hypothetical protein
VRALGWLLLASACGRIDFDPLTATDAAADTFSCNAVELLSDNFDNASAGAQWVPFAEPGVVVTETNALTITLASNALGYAGYTSACRYDFNGMRAMVEVTQTPTSVNGVEMALQARLGATNHLGVIFRIGNIDTYTRIADSYLQTSTTPYNPAAHRYWYLEARNGMVTWGVSPDGIALAPLHAQAAPFDVSSIVMRLSSGTFVADANPGQATFDNFRAGRP